MTYILKQEYRTEQYWHLKLRYMVSERDSIKVPKCDLEKYYTLLK